MKNLKVKNVISKITAFKDDYPIMAIYIIGNFLNAILLRVFTTGHFHVRSIFFDIANILFLSGLALLISNKNRQKFYFWTTFLMIATCLINSLYYNYYKSFVSISLLATSVFVKDVGDAIVDMVVRPCDLSYLWLFIALFIAKKKCEEHNVNKYKSAKIALIAVISLAIGCIIPPYSSFGRLYKLWNRGVVLDNWGPYVYQTDDIIQSLKPAFNNVFGYDKALRDTNEYFKKNAQTVNYNDYTGIFEGKNVITIHAESLQTFTIGQKFNGQEVTPNINKLVNNGIYFNNYYAQVGVGSSSDTEFTYATSLLPANTGTVFVNYANNKFITMQNLLKNKGYYVFSMHGNNGDFWNRDNMHLNMGYDKYYSKDSFVIDEEYGLGLSDGSFFRQVVPKIKDISDNIGTPYYGTLITLTNHTPWRDANKYDELDLSLSVNIDGKTVRREYLNDTMIGRYLKSVNYMDKVIGNFIDELDKNGLLDNTVIIIYGDHDAKIAKKQFDYMYNYDPVNDVELTPDDSEYVTFNDYDYELSRKVPLIIWSKDMTKSEVIDTPMGMIDALPTIGNMLGIYNKYALGKDVMSIKKEDGIVVFKDSSFITDKVYYSAKNDETYAITNGVLENDYIDKRIDYADKLIEISNNIIIYDLIDKLD